MSNTLTERIRANVRKAVIDTIIDDEEIWKALDEALQEDLETSSCHLLFDGEPEVLVGLGSGDAAHSYPVEIGVETYTEIKETFPAHKQSLISQIQGIDKLIADLNDNRSLLTEALKRYPEEEAMFTAH